MVSNDSGLMHIAAAAGAAIVELSCHPAAGLFCTEILRQDFTLEIRSISFCKPLHLAGKPASGTMFIAYLGYLSVSSWKQ
jgi:hypothetical protein